MAFMTEDMRVFSEAEVERVFNEVKAGVETNPKAEFYIRDLTLGIMFSVAYSIIPKNGTISLTYLKANGVIRIEIELSGKSFIKKSVHGIPTFARIVGIYSEGFDYSAEEYPNYDGTIL